MNIDFCKYLTAKKYILMPCHDDDRFFKVEYNLSGLRSILFQKEKKKSNEKVKAAGLSQQQSHCNADV